MSQGPCCALHHLKCTGAIKLSWLDHAVQDSLTVMIGHSISIWQYLLQTLQLHSVRQAHLSDALETALLGNSWTAVLTAQPVYVSVDRCPEELPADVAEAVVSCRALDPKDRPSARQLFSQLTSLSDSPVQPAFRSLSSSSSAGSDISQWRSEQISQPSQPPISKSGTLSSRTPEGLEAISEAGTGPSGLPQGGSAQPLKAVEPPPGPSSPQ